MNFCKNAKSNSGVSDARFYWQNPNVVAIIVEHDGSWGPNVEPSGQTMKTFFDLADLSTCTMDEPWIEAGLGQREHKRFQAKIGGSIFLSVKYTNVVFDNLKTYAISMICV